MKLTVECMSVDNPSWRLTRTDERERAYKGIMIAQGSHTPLVAERVMFEGETGARVEKVMIGYGSRGERFMIDAAMLETLVSVLKTLPPSPITIRSTEWQDAECAKLDKEEEERERRLGAQPEAS